MQGAGGRGGCGQFFELIDYQNMIVAAVTAIIWGILSKTKVNPMYMPPDSPEFAYPKVESQTFPVWLFGIILAAAAVVTVLTLFMLSVYYPKRFRRFNIFTSAWTLITMVSLSAICTNIFKSYVGRARPDTYAYCGQNVTYEECTNLPENKRDNQFKSWPSGHSSSSMSGFLFLALFIQKAVIMEKLWLTLITALYVLMGVYVGASRIVDYRHRPDDVTAGLFIGFIFTFLVWEHVKDSMFEKEDNEMEKIPNP